jgi:hypothetical protein
MRPNRVNPLTDASGPSSPGEEGIWFADEEQARLRRINWLTLALDVPLYAGRGAGGLLAVGLGLLQVLPPP